MKETGNNGKENVPERDLWETKQELWDKLNKQYNFEFDCCASKSNAKIAFYSTNFKSILKIDYLCWMNPPFSKAFDMFKHFFKVVTKGVAIYRCDNMETKVWQDIILKNADWIFIPNKRIAYEGLNGKRSRFPSALIGYKVEY